MASFDRRHPILFGLLAVVLIAPAPWMLLAPLLGVWPAVGAALGVSGLLLLPLWMRLQKVQTTGSTPCWSCGREVPLTRLFGFCIACGAYPKGMTPPDRPQPV